MKYTGMPMAMWALFRKSFQKNLASVLNYDEAAALEIAGKAKPDYKRIINRLPEFEKEDLFRMNIINCAMFSSFILHMYPQPSVDQLTEYYKQSMLTPAMRWFCRKGG